MFRDQLKDRSKAKIGLSIAVAFSLEAACSQSETPCTAYVPVTVAAFVPPGLPVRCMDAADFDFEGRVVRLSHVEYGALVDCESGCYSSHVCAIEDPALVAPELFLATWSLPEERPDAVAIDCPGLPDGVLQTVPHCVPPGLRHPVVATSDFRDWAARESRNEGPLRVCVNFYGFAGNWP